MIEIAVPTGQHTELIAINEPVQRAVTESGVKNGVCTIVVPHTTAGITINENADPDVIADMIYALDKLVPWRDSNYEHSEGNTAAHVKSSLLGHSVQVLVRNGRLQFGTWQGIFFCEFDGPRTRKVWITVSADCR